MLVEEIAIMECSQKKQSTLKFHMCLGTNDDMHEEDSERVPGEKRDIT